MSTPILLYQHTFLAAGWTLRLTETVGFVPLYASTLRPGQGVPILAVDVVLAVRAEASAAGMLMAQVWANRVVW